MSNGIETIIRYIETKYLYNNGEEIPFPILHIIPNTDRNEEFLKSLKEIDPATKTIQDLEQLQETEEDKLALVLGTPRILFLPDRTEIVKVPLDLLKRNLIVATTKREYRHLLSHEHTRQYRFYFIVDCYDK